MGQVTRVFFKTIQDHLQIPSFPGESPTKHDSRSKSKYLHLIGRLEVRQLNIRTPNPAYSNVARLLIPDDALLHQILPQTIWKRPKLHLLNWAFTLSVKLEASTRISLNPAFQNNPHGSKISVNTSPTLLVYYIAILGVRLRQQNLVQPSPTSHTRILLNRLILIMKLKNATLMDHYNLNRHRWDARLFLTTETFLLGLLGRLATSTLLQLRN